MATSAPTAPSNKQTVRIQRDLKALQDNPLPFVRDLQLSVSDNANQLTGTLLGPEGTAYAGKAFRFVMRFPPEYPFQMPEFGFDPAIVHPNVDAKTGTVCHDVLHATWAPNVTLSHVLSEIHNLLANPNHNTPLQAGS